MRIALFGADGQVGREIISAAAGRRDFELQTLRRADADLLKPGAARAAVLNSRPDIVINAAAWTAVDRAEAEQAAAFGINADAAGEVAAACRDVGARIVHISTDYVFSGVDQGVRLCESAATAPLNVYGQSKLRGEELVAAAAPDSIILRTSWVYSAHGGNFVKTMLRLSETRDEVSVVADQIGGPTPAAAIARACLTLGLRKDGPSGLYHFQGAPAASWAEFADAIFAAAERPVTVKRIATSEYPTPAARPHYTVLDCAKINSDYELAQPDWRADLKQTVSKILAA